MRLWLVLLPFLLLFACRKSDTTAPDLQLLGGDSITQNLPLTAGAGVFIDPGYIAEDDEDGALTGNVSVVNSVNPNRKGEYSIIYTVTDESGNTTQRIRHVFIINEAEIFGGAYPNCRDTLSSSAVSYAANLVVSDTVNRLVRIINFSNYASWIWATLGDSSILVPAGQYLDTNLTRYIDNIFTPPTLILNNNPPTRLRIRYSWTDGMSADTCTAWLQR
ncbi:MAG: DUF5011 domain-containing protein [Bacteroidia bacterium]|nr:DUF5011 domain-containing protein [Bacteroidia bacterium]